MKKSLVKVLLGLLFIFQASYSYINIYPVKFDKKIDGEGGSQSYFLYNSTNKSVRYRIYTEKNPTDESKDMSEWIEVYPKGATLKPGEEKEIKVLIKAPLGTKSGEYLGILGVKEVEIPEDKSLRETGKGIVQVFTDLKIEIAGFVGDIKPVLEMKNFKIKVLESGEVNLTGKLKNTGEKRGIFQFYLFNSKGKEKCLLGEKRILKGKELDLSKLEFLVSDSEMKKDIKKYDSMGIIEKGNKDGIKKVILLKK